jgi:guanine deaminase
MRQAYRGRILTPTEAGEALRFLDDGLLVVEDGRIAAVTPFDRGAREGGAQTDVSGEATASIIDLHPRILLPGFVDTHLHFPQTRVIGSASGPLLDWLERTVFPEETRFQRDDYARIVAKEFIRKLLSSGTTTSAIFSSSSERATAVLFEELSEAGLRAAVGLTLMDQRAPEALCVPREEALAACERLIAAWHGHDGGRLSFAITPRFALSCSRRLMEDAARLAAEHDLLIQTHISENPAEGAEVLSVHPYGGDYLGIYEVTGLVTSRTLLAHAIHLSPAEWDRVAARGARIAHCPDSNFFLGSGRMRLLEASQRGIKVGLGSDVAAGRSFSLRRAMAYAYDNALTLGHPLSPEALLTMATLGGARALGLDAAIGSLEVGKDADFIALHLPAHVESQAQILGQIAFGEEGAVERVFVRGRKVG